MVKENNILFVNLPSIHFDELYAKINAKDLQFQPLCMPLGLLYISSYMREHNELDKVALLDYVLYMDKLPDYKNVEDFIEGIVKSAIKFTPNIIAFSLIFSSSHKFFLVCHDIIKSIWPEAVTVVGGTHATNCTRYLLENGNVDYVIRGEGELAFSEFVKKSSRATPINIPGVYSRAKLQSAASLELSEPVEDLDTLPFPDWTLIDMESYVTSRGRRRGIKEATEKRMATIMTTRGCPFRCTFCSSYTVHGRKMRFRSIENVIEEIKLLNEKYGVDLLIPEDDLFTAKKQRIINLLTEINNIGIPDLELQFPNGLSINTLDEEILDGLIRAGMKVANLAIESGSEYIQKYVINKNCNLKKARKLIKYLRDNDIIVRCYFILGFPSETKDQIMETINYAKSLEADWCVFNIATPLVGSKMYRQFIELGYLKENIDIWSNTFFQKRNFDTQEVSASDLEELAYRANLDCNFINNPNRRNGQYEKAIVIYQDILNLYPFHIIAWYCIMECYKEMNDYSRANSAENKIKQLIEEDKRSKEMYHKYGDLISNIVL
jgi:anaerobic magnesium-protoporphyrin IX monomethyl ester cyclase